MLIPIGEPKPQPVFTSQVKMLFKKGKLRGVRYGIYGDELNLKNVTDEHVIPKSWGGVNTDDNIALASRINNNKRGNRPLSEFITAETLKQYIDQFMDINLPEWNFKGKVYIQNLLNSINKALDMEKKMKHIDIQA